MPLVLSSEPVMPSKVKNMRYEVKRKVWIECKIPDEDGRYSDYRKKELQELNAYEAVKQWAKESMYDSLTPSALHLEDAIQLIQKSFKISREPAYRRAIKATMEYACLSFQIKGRNKFIVYNRFIDNPEEDRRMKEARKERQRKFFIEKGLALPPELTITEEEKEEEDSSSVETIIPEKEEEPINDIYTRLMKAEKRRKEELSRRES